MSAKGVREVRITAFQCVLCQTVYRTEEEAASCYRLCVTADEDPISKLFAYQRRQLQKEQSDGDKNGN